MAKPSWKASSLLATILLIALGLQAGALKILLDLSRRPDPGVTTLESGAAPSGPPSGPVAPPVSAPLEAERWPAIDPPPPDAHDPATWADPPHLADPAAEAEPPVAEVSPPDPTPTPAPEAAALAMAKLAELAAEQSAVAPPQPATFAPTPTKSNQTAAPAAPPAEPPTATQLQDATWLRTRDPGRYTIQLFSGKDLDKLKEVAAMIGSDEPRAYFMTGSRTSPWYSLVLGDYPDASTARAAAANLTASLALKPWVRRFDDIQSSLR